MPKRPTKRETNRTAPYNLRTSTAMAAAITSPMATWAPHHQPQSLSWSDQAMGYPHHHQHMMAAYMAPMHTPVATPQPLPVQRSASTQPGQSAPWTTEEDNLLMDAKSHGLGWNDIQKKHFPKKSGNACRKRHERLMLRLRTTDWDEGRIRRVIAEYNAPGFREEFWRHLSDRVQENWMDVERVCFQQGLKGLRAKPPYHARNQSRGSSSVFATSEYERGSSLEAENDDSGVVLEVSGSRRPSQLINTTSAPSLEHILHHQDHGYYR